MTTKASFFADLRSTIQAHLGDVGHVFQSLDDALLAWRPEANEWSILICFDHLNQTYRYYQAKIERALVSPARVEGGVDVYHASFWGSIYMFFALNPRWSFPTPDALMPNAAPGRAVLRDYVEKQRELLDLMGTLEPVDLTRTRIPIEKGVSFNLGDCLKILVYHDSLHIRQAHSILAQHEARVQSSARASS